MPEILKNIKAEDRLRKIRIVSENDDVMGGQPEADGMKENDNNAIFDLACSVMHALAEVAKVDQKAIPQILDALGDSRTAGASQRIVNEVNKLAKAAQTAANQANDKANTANTAAATADKKAVAAQNTANSANAAAKKAQTTADTAFKLLGDLKTINLDTLNSNDKCGVYYQTANATATPERNYPVKLAGTLEVFIAAGMTQRYTVYSTHDVYIRNNYGGKWDAWTKIPNTSDLIKVSDAFGDSRTLAGSQRTINEVNRATKAAQTAANQANDKANTANTAAATADKKAVAAQTKADSAYHLANTANGAAANALKTANDKGNKNTAKIQSSGWWKCGDTGLIKQWGVAKYSASSEFFVDFPISFTESVYTIQITQINKSWSKVTTNTLPFNISNARFQVAQNIDDKLDFSWEALGK